MQIQHGNTWVIIWNHLLFVRSYCWWKKSGSPVDMVNIPLFTWLYKFYTSQVVVWDFFHQQYDSVCIFFYRQYTSFRSYNIVTSIMFDLSTLIVQSIPQQIYIYIYHITNLLGQELRIGWSSRERLLWWFMQSYSIYWKIWVKWDQLLM